jgi:hypothetical protein
VWQPVARRRARCNGLVATRAEVTRRPLDAARVHPKNEGQSPKRPTSPRRRDGSGARARSLVEDVLVDRQHLCQRATELLAGSGDSQTARTVLGEGCCKFALEGSLGGEELLEPLFRRGPYLLNSRSAHREQ